MREKSLKVCGNHLFSLTVLGIYMASCHAYGQTSARPSPTLPDYRVQGTSGTFQQLSGPLLGLGSGPIGVGDSVGVDVFDAPEMTTRSQVSASGDIAVPLIGNFHIQGLTAEQAALSLQRLLKERELFISPRVIVSVQQVSGGVTVLGQVRNPGIYRIGAGRKLADIIALAGGTTDHAGHLVVVRFPDSRSPQFMSWDPSLRTSSDEGQLVGEGDTVEMTACGVVYMGGNLNRPGAYPLCDTINTTVSQAIALAGGERPSSKSSQTLLLREDEKGVRVPTRLNLHRILIGKSDDPILRPNDIIYVPPSDLKAGLKIATQAAIGFASQALVYSVQR